MLDVLDKVDGEDDDDGGGCNDYDWHQETGFRLMSGPQVIGGGCVGAPTSPPGKFQNHRIHEIRASRGILYLCGVHTNGEPVATLGMLLLSDRAAEDAATLLGYAARQLGSEL